MSKSDEELLGFLGKQNDQHRTLAGAILEFRSRTLLRSYTRYTFAIAVASAVAAAAAVATVIIAACAR